MLFLGRNQSLSGGSVMVRKSAVILCALALSVATTAFAQTDTALSASVKTNLAADETVKASSVKVATVDHVVTLTGTVPSQAVKDRALQIARETTGVTSVVDKLTIGDVPAGKTTAQKAAGGVEKGVDKSADAVGTAAHKSAGAVDKSKEKVGEAAEKTGEAIGTAAKATGKAVDTAAHKTAEATEKAAEKTKDATTSAGHKTKEATSGTAGKAEDAVTDAAITTAVKSKLLGDGKTPGLKIDVDTDNGIVTLNGDVATAEARAEAVRLARGTKGVKRVVDKLTVGGK
jgi:hyperosmotically inducible protein